MKGTPLYPAAYNVQIPLVDSQKYRGDYVVETGKIFPRTISRRQFFQYLAVIGIISEDDAFNAVSQGIIPKPLTDIINTLPASMRFSARMLVVSAQQFDIDHQLSDTVRKALGWSEDQKKDFWQKAFVI
uniref:Uncharacterized protein n=1 Tax=Rhizobium phage IG49 TaxID=3129228 RepID=A0AAU8HYD5_9CAUD